MEGSWQHPRALRWEHCGESYSFWPKLTPHPHIPNSSIGHTSWRDQRVHPTSPLPIPKHSYLLNNATQLSRQLIKMPVFLDATEHLGVHPPVLEGTNQVSLMLLPELPPVLLLHTLPHLNAGLLQSVNPALQVLSPVHLSTWAGGHAIDLGTVCPGETDYWWA